MSILDRASLEESPLADLHTIASELSMDGYRRLRKAELIDRILERQGEGDGGVAPEAEAEAETDTGTVAETEPDTDGESAAETDAEPAPRRRRGRRGGRGRGGASAREESADAADDVPEDRAEEPEQAKKPEQADEPKQERPDDRAPGADEEILEGVVELIAGGSGFVRVDPPEPSDNDVYISAAQVKRCELVTGDRVSGPRRAPRRSERFASLVRIDTINGRPAGELADGVHFDELPAAFPSERFRLDGEEPTANAIEQLAPIGRGSRVTIVGGAQTGKTEVLKRLAAQLSAIDGLEVWVALAGARPEEIAEWRAGPVPPAAAASLAASPDARGQAVEGVVEQARRMAARGTHGVVLIDTLDGLHPHTARAALAAARNIVDGGSVTVIATASEPLGGETTVIALDSRLAADHEFPAIDRSGTWTMRADLLLAE